MTQNEAVILTLEKLGGVGTLGQLNQEVLKIQECKLNTKTPFASIRRIVQLHNEIYKIRPGLYGLKRMQKINENNGIIVETEKNKNSTELIEFNHTYYQGLLLTVGNLKNLDTFVPNQDKNRHFINQKLGEIRTLNIIPSYSYPNIVKRSSTVDVIWFNERNMPHSFFEVEHSTDIQNSLLKFNDLQDFYARMVIVADDSREVEYLSKIRYSAFKLLADNKRISFLGYEALNAQYESELKRSTYNFLL